MTNFTKAPGLDGCILAARFAKQKRISNLGLWARGQFTPFYIVCVGKLGHALEIRGLPLVGNLSD